MQNGNKKHAIKVMICNLILVVLFFSCNKPTQNKNVKQTRKYTLNIHSGEGLMNSGYSTVECDSFNMVNKNECIFWSDGVQGKIIAKDIMPSTN